jgi:hypothetical protein
MPIRTVAEVAGAMMKEPTEEEIELIRDRGTQLAKDFGLLVAEALSPMKDPAQQATLLVMPLAAILGLMISLWHEANPEKSYEDVAEEIVRYVDALVNESVADLRRDGKLPQ